MLRLRLEPHLMNGAKHRGPRGARLARRDDREYREYLRKEQRRQPGCIAGRMPPAFMRWGSKMETETMRVRFSLVASTCLVAMIGLAAQEPATDYSQWRGRQRDGSASAF